MKLALLLAAWSVLWLGAAAASGEPRPAAAAPELLAGAGTVDVTPPVGVPLAGYGGMRRRLPVPDLLDRYPAAFWFKPSTGVHDPILARALVLQSGARRILWLAVDLVGVDPGMLQALRERLAAAGLGYETLILAASHTHSGPGAFSASGLFGLLALDRLVPEVRERLLDGMTEAARRADRARAPARVGIGRGEAAGLARSRLGLPLDPEVGVLKVTGTDGRPSAVLWNYAIHPTALGASNLLLSGDLTGAASREIERALGVPALYVNGAQGDVSPALHGWEGVRQAAAALSGEVLAVWRRTEVEPTAGLGALTAPLRLPPPALSLRNCLGRWIPRSLAVGIGWGLPAESEMVAVRIGRSAWVTIPGELETRLGRSVKAEARRLFGQGFVVGVANGYAGYLLTPEAYARPGYIACASLYGAEGGNLVAARATALLKALRAAGDGTPPAGRGQ